jgi:hypothetical protein
MSCSNVVKILFLKIHFPWSLRKHMPPIHPMSPIHNKIALLNNHNQ